MRHRLNSRISLRYGALICLVTLSVPLKAAPPLTRPELFTIYSVGDIRASQSDVEGSVCAAGNIELTKYSVGLKELGGKDSLSLCARGDIQFQHGSVEHGSVEVGGTANFNNFSISKGALAALGDVNITEGMVDGDVSVGGRYSPGNVFVWGGIFNFKEESLKVNHHDVVSSLYKASAHFSALKPTGTVQILKASVVLKGRAGLNVFNVSKNDLQKASIVKILAPKSAQVIVNVMGRGSLQIIDKHLELAGGITAHEVIYNMPQITFLHVERAGDTLGSRQLGVQGTILAPYASMVFRDALIVGALYVGSLDSLRGGVRKALFRAWPNTDRNTQRNTL